jgi:SAM-dependent methyltransferase
MPIERNSLAGISPLNPRDFGDRVVLDAGCGKGRHIFLAAQFKARTVVGVDLSDAIEAAYPAAIILILIVPTNWGKTNPRTRASDCAKGL